jgi:hypothetical protein
MLFPLQLKKKSSLETSETLVQLRINVECWPTLNKEKDIFACTNIPARAPYPTPNNDGDGDILLRVRPNY